jgi:hypothetical protein
MEDIEKMSSADMQANMDLVNEFMRDRMLTPPAPTPPTPIDSLDAVKRLSAAEMRSRLPEVNAFIATLR